MERGAECGSGVYYCGDGAGVVESPVNTSAPNAATDDGAAYPRWPNPNRSSTLFNSE